MNLPNLTISQVAQLAEVNIETVRYYQRIGLLALPEKPSNGYRRYSVKTVEHISVIKRAQNLGFTLKEIGRVFHPALTGTCEEISALTASKVKLLEHKLAELTQLKNTLVELTGQCSTCQAQDMQACTILQAVRDHRPV
ncbi:MerR family transcriptional regulator [Alcaligenaceae bacterium]|nr:MerR family transcriptional regulator [Alcaligenaceae bacterium]